jgi:D-glycero-alpha-D-manno-heptose 1-phosphate guanylyltransferase
MMALILAGGLGTRLASVLADRPKTLAPAGGKPFVEHQLAQLQRQGFTDVTLCVGHRAEQIQNELGNGGQLGVRLSYSVERQGLLGTAGAIRQAAGGLEASFLVLNGDSYLETDFPDLASFHRERRARDPSLAATIAAVEVDEAAAYGSLSLNGERKVTGFAEKGAVGPGWVNAGAYVLEPAILDLIPDGPVSLEQETFPLALDFNLVIAAYPVAGFVDIGTPEGYRRFCERVEVAG